MEAGVGSGGGSLSISIFSEPPHVYSPILKVSGDHSDGFGLLVILSDKKLSKLTGRTCRRNVEVI